jgi:hypothetical protein
MSEAIALMNAMVPHLIVVVVLALLLSGAIALLSKRHARGRMYHAGYLFVCCVASVVAGSWIMYLIHG